MNLMLDSFLDNSNGIAILVVLILMAIVGIALIVSYIVAFFMRINLIHKYRKYNKQTTEKGFTSMEAGRALLDALEMPEVEVKKSNWFLQWIFGNYYNIYKKQIKLRRNISDKNSITAVAVACQKVGLAHEAKTGDKSTNLYLRLQPLIVFTPFMYLPVMIICTVLDVVFLSSTGTLMMVGSIIATLLFIIPFIVMILSLSVEKKADAKCLEFMQTSKFLNEEEMVKMQDLFKLYQLNRIIDFITSILYLIWILLKIVLKVLLSAWGKKQ